VKIGIRCVCGAMLDTDDGGATHDMQAEVGRVVFASEIVMDRWLELHENCNKVYTPLRVTNSEARH
jgi:hypothetical protein